MRVTTRAFLALAVLFWLLATPPPSGAASEGGGPPDHGKSGQDQGNGNHGHGIGNRGPENQGGNGRVAHEKGEGDDEGGGSDTGACGAAPGDAAQLAAVRAMVAEQCDCGSASNHGQYVKCVAHVANAAVRDGSLPAGCHDAVVHCAAMSACGKKNSVACCRTDAQGTTRCSIKHSAAACKAPRGGTACVGTVSSCCDACGAGTCPSPGSTTTTAPSVTSTTAAASTTTTSAASTTTSAPPGSTSTTSTLATTTTTMKGSPSGAFVDLSDRPLW